MSFLAHPRVVVGAQLYPAQAPREGPPTVVAMFHHRHSNAQAEFSWLAPKLRGRFLRQVSDRKIVVWGSGFGATLPLQSVAENASQVERVIAMAPGQGGALSRCDLTTETLSRIAVPIMVMRGESELSQPGRAEQKQMFEAAGIADHVVSETEQSSNLRDRKRKWRVDSYVLARDPAVPGGLPRV